MNFCFLKEYESWEDALLKLGHSKQKIKKSLPSKKRKEKLKGMQAIQIPGELINYGEINPTYIGDKVVVLREEEDFLAISKPSGVHIHPLSYHESDNLLSFLRQENYFSYLDINLNNYDRGLLYRLDFETSGLVLLTKNQQIYDSFREGLIRETDKEYLACLEGETPQVFQWEGQLLGKGDRVVVHPQGKMAQITGERIEKRDGFSFVKVKLFEGYRHQIRAIASHYGFPVANDKLYGAQEAFSYFGLHCYRYRFEWMGKKYCFEDTECPFLKI